ncbi:DNA topoisomerase IB [Rhizobium sp. LEGMi135b]
MTVPRRREEIVYVASLEKGITRKRSRNGFIYFDANGRRITAAKELDRLSALAIPPAYRDVIISPNPNSHLQAVGRDVKGRKQYRYHPQWIAIRDNEKFAQLAEFGRLLPAIRERMDVDLRQHRPGLTKALATVVSLMDKLFIRIGNETYAAENGSYGLTTLRNRHIRLVGSRLQFHFKGKSGKEWRLWVTDRRIIRAIRMLQELPGQHLFQYVDESGLRHPISSQDVNAYIQQTTGCDDFTSRQFRLWGATCLAATALSLLDPKETARGRARQINEVVDDVAAALVNTRSVCRESYIHPRVFEDFEAGRLKMMAQIHAKKRSAALKWMGKDELAVFQWLDVGFR